MIAFWNKCEVFTTNDPYKSSLARDALKAANVNFLVESKDLYSGTFSSSHGYYGSKGSNIPASIYSFFVHKKDADRARYILRTIH